MDTCEEQGQDGPSNTSDPPTSTDADWLDVDSDMPVKSDFLYALRDLSTRYAIRLYSDTDMNSPATLASAAGSTSRH